MSSKPRQKHLNKVHIKQDGKYDFKPDKPWNKREVEKERSIFDNITMGDLMEGFNNRGNQKRFARHTFRQRME